MDYKEFPTRRQAVIFGLAKITAALVIAAFAFFAMPRMEEFGKAHPYWYVIGGVGTLTVAFFMAVSGILDVADALVRGAPAPKARGGSRGSSSSSPSSDDGFFTTWFMTNHIADGGGHHHHHDSGGGCSSSSDCGSSGSCD